MSDFTKAVKKAMRTKDVRPSELAKQTGYSNQYIIDLLGGKRRWNENTIEKVSDALGIKITFAIE